MPTHQLFTAADWSRQTPRELKQRCAEGLVAATRLYQGTIETTLDRTSAEYTKGTRHTMNVVLSLLHTHAPCGDGPWTQTHEAKARVLWHFPTIASTIVLRNSDGQCLRESSNVAAGLDGSLAKRWVRLHDRPLENRLRLLQRFDLRAARRPGPLSVLTQVLDICVMRYPPNSAVRDHQAVEPICVLLHPTSIPPSPLHPPPACPVWRRIPRAELLV